LGGLTRAVDPLDHKEFSGETMLAVSFHSAIPRAMRCDELHAKSITAPTSAKRVAIRKGYSNHPDNGG
jgi:hypothetical protein